MKRLFLITILALSSLTIWAQDKPYNDYNARRRDQFKVLSTSPKDIIFLGNSITDGGEWGELLGDRHVKNRGISGDRVEWMFDRIDVIINGQPKKIFLMIGINDLIAGRTPQQVSDDIARIAEMVIAGSPRTQLYIQSTLPMNCDDFAAQAKRKGINDKVKAVNDAVRQMCDAKGITYIDLHPYLRDAKGNLSTRYSTDGLHLTGEGYMIWRDAIKKYAKK